MDAAVHSTHAHSSVSERIVTLTDAANTYHCGVSDCWGEQKIATCLCACPGCREAHVLLEQAEDDVRLEAV